MNPEVVFESFPVSMQNENAIEIIEGSDVIIDGFNENYRIGGVPSTLWNCEDGNINYPPKWKKILSHIIFWSYKAFL